MTEEFKPEEFLEESVELTQEQQAAKFRDAIVKTALDNELSFNVVFGALTQVAVTFIFDYNLLESEELSVDGVAAGVERFNQQVKDFSVAALDHLREQVRLQQEADAEITQ